MTIEEEFFEVLGVDNCSNCDRKKSLECYYCDDKYPEITAEIQLKLICILTIAKKHFELPKIYTIQEMKDYILQTCIIESEGIYTRVKSLFEEEDEK